MWIMPLNVEIGDQISKLFCRCEMYFGAPKQCRKGSMISIKILQRNEEFVILKKQKSKETCQDLTPMSKFDDPSK